ncbi:MAG TPA: hypothetical protein VGI54_11780 [Solirubrobacteraceae bacterium]
MRRAVGGLVAVGALALPAAALAEPVDLSVHALKRVGEKTPFKVSVGVRADAGALDIATAPLRLRVRLAPECGGTYGGTTGPKVMDRRLAPAPVAGRPYAARLTGTGKVPKVGTYAVCAFLEEKGDSRQFATAVDTTVKVVVSKRCTAARKKVKRLQAKLRHSHRSAVKAKLRRQIRAAKKTVKRAC